jgi:hypothetical protein
MISDKGKGQVHPRTAHEGPDRQFISIVPLTSALDGVGVNATPRPLYPQERLVTHCIGGWVGPRASLDVRGKILPPPGFDPRTVRFAASCYTD